ncbi:efflux RND transporter periplasmic adaptor subunit [Globicatella sanguinis]
MNIKRKLILGIIGGLIALTGIFFFAKNTFFPTQQDEMMGSENMDLGPDGMPVEGEMAYTLYNLFRQDPVTVDASVKLKTDTAYFYQADLGEIEAILVKDGQKVTKGTTLYNYKQTSKENQYALEDLYREQTKLYNTRQALIKQLSDYTGGEYNYQGDQIAYYWGNDGKQVYYIVKEIGKSTSTSVNVPANTNTDSSLSQDSPEGALDTGGMEMSAMESATDPSEGIKEQIRQVNEQIEELEIKLIRQQELQNNKVLAKTDGIAMVNPDAKDNPNVPVVRIVSEESSVVGSVTEYDFYALAEDRAVNIYIPAEDRTVTGKIVDYDKIPSYSGTNGQTDSAEGLAASNPGGGSNASQFSFVVQPDEPLQAGFSAKVNITLPGFAIPSDAIVEEGEDHYVFLYLDGKAVKTKIELMTQGLQKVVLKGLNEGDQLIMYPYDLTDGQAVSVVDPMAMPPAEEPMDGDVQ